MHAAPPKRTPFDHYKQPAQLTPKVNPYRLITRKLGITEAAFEVRLQYDIDSLVKEIEDARNAPEELTPPSANENFSPPPDAAPVEKALSKDECFRRVMGSEFNTCSLLGMYLWAADLGRARYWNFDMKWDKESIELLNAYN